jgi:PAS domain S-box-containing protein
MKKLLKVLHVEDSERDVALLTRYLTRAGYDLISDRVQTPEAMRTALESKQWDAILCDYSMPQFNALDALALMKGMELDIPFIIISGTVGEAVAVEAMRAGAHDYLMKNNLARLAPTIEREMHEAENRRARSQAEAELRKSEAQYRRLIDTAYEGIWIADVRAHITYANQHLAEMLGYSVEEIIGRSAFEFLDESTREEMKIMWQRRVEGVEEQYDLRLQRKDGSDIWVILSITPIRDEQAEVTGALAMLTDITERKRAEQHIRLQATALKSAANAIVITDNKGIISWVNPAFTALTGYTLEEITGRSTRILKSGEHDAAFYQKLWGTILSGQIWHGEMINRRQDGSLYFEEQTITPVMNEAGEIINFVGIKQDITERKRAEEALRESEERYKGLIDSAFDGVVIHQNGTIISANRAYAEMFGYTVEELIGRNVLELSPPEFRDFVAAEIRLDESLYEAVGLKKDGTHINIEVSAKNCLYEGERARLAAVRDITERKQAEEQLRRQLDFTEAITTSLGEGVYALDERGRVTFMNPAAQATLGWTEAELLGQDMHEVIHFQTADGTRKPRNDCPLLAVLTSGQMVEIEGDVFTREDGSIFPVSYTSSPIISEGQIVGAVLFP